MTTVVPPAVAVLVEPLTMPLPAVIEVATPPAATLPRPPLELADPGLIPIVLAFEGARSRQVKTVGLRSAGLGPACRGACRCEAATSRDAPTI